jgi:hypothetical protein
MIAFSPVGLVDVSMFIVLLRPCIGRIQAQWIVWARIVIANVASYGNDRPHQRYQTQYEYRKQNSHESQT